MSNEAFKDSIESVARRLPAAMSEDYRDEEEEVNRIYLSRGQLRLINFGSNYTFARCGRGFGKTTTMAYIAAQILQSVERGLLLFCGASYKAVMCRTSPAMVKTWEQLLHWKEGIHFYRGHAPKAAGFAEPMTRPRTWENVIHFWDGSILYLASLAVEGSTNGLSSVGIMLDEARYAPWAKFKEEVLPTLRGEVYDHPGWKKHLNPRYLSLTVVSDAALSQKQAAWEKEREDVTTEVNEKICEMLAELDICPELAQMPQFVQQLNFLRSKSKAFFNMSSVENVAVLTEDYIKKMQRNLPPLMFNIQIMGQWRGAAKDGYYANFDIDIHGYAPNPHDEMEVLQKDFNSKHKYIIDIGGTTKKIDYEALDLEQMEAINDCRMDVDCLPGVPLRLTLDTNKNINCFCIAQQYKYQGIESIMILKTMYTLNERRLRSLCADFHKYYAPHMATCKDVILYFDSTNKGSNYALEEDKALQFYNVIKDELEKRSWKVTLVDMGVPMAHELKYQFVNDVLTGQKNIMVRVNKLRNDYLIASLENSRITFGKNGVRKDKGVEKLKRAADIAMAEADERSYTDMSDCFDNMLIGCVNYPTGTRKGTWGRSSVHVWMPD